jgi:hypothetical protein
MSQHLSMGDGVGRAAAVGAALGLLVMAVVATGIVLLAGGALGDAVGIAAFAALWTGPGMGALFGAVTAIERRARTETTAID